MEPLEARDLFPLCGRYIYMNHAASSPLSERGRAALAAVVERLSAKPLTFEWLMEMEASVRGSLGRLLGVQPESLAFVRSTAHGISLMAQGLDWKAGDNVVGARGEFPTNVYPWMALRDRGVEYRMAEPVDGRVLPEAIFELVNDRTRVVALSQVEFWNGFRVDLASIGDECRRRGILFAVDAIQGVGALRTDLGALPVDLAAAGAYKWLLGPGGIGFLYCRLELAPWMRPALVGLTSVKSREFFAYDLEYRDDAGRFEESPSSAFLLAVFGAALDLLLEVGPQVVEERVLHLARMFGEGLTERGYEVVEPWPRRPEESSGIVSFRKPGAAQSEILRDLNASRVVATGHPNQDFVRLSPHFYNTEDEVARVLEVLAPESVKSA